MAKKRKKITKRKHFKAPWWKFFFVVAIAAFIAIPLSERVGLNLYSTGDVAGVKTSNLIALGGCQGGESQCPTPSPLPKTYTVTGKIVNYTTKRPVRNVKTVLNNYQGTLQTVYTNSNGQYTFKHVRNGSYSVRTDCSNPAYITVYNSAKKVSTISFPVCR